MTLSRRTFLASSAAVITATQMRGEVQPPALPLHLLTQTFMPLRPSLLPVDAWKPYPTASDRAGWMALPADVREALLERAKAENVGAWNQLLATDELEFKRNGNRSRFEALHFARRARLAELVMGECVANDGTYLDQVANGLWLICEESFWGLPAHLSRQRAGAGLADTDEPIIDLFAAETAATVAWVVYLLGPQLDAVSPQLVKRAHAETKRRILDPYLQRNDFGWSGLDGKPHHLNNWNPWINSNVLTAGLVFETDAARRAQVVDKVCRSTDEFLADCSPDGGCEEGPGYWGRAAASFFDVCDTLVRAHGGKGDAVLRHPFLYALGHYIPAVHIAGRFYVNYGDAHVTDAPPPDVMYRFGRATGDDALMQLGALDATTRGLAASGKRLHDNVGGTLGGVASFSRALAAVMCSGEIRTVAKRDALPRDAWYPSLGLMTARERADSADGFYLAMQAASNGRSHAHNDSGSVIVYQNGEPVFIDVGVGTYEAKTFSRDRYTIWTMQSASHNLPTIAGVMQHDGDRYKARVDRYDMNDRRSTLRADLAPAYPREAGVTRWMRSATLDRTARCVRLEEDFQLAKAAPVMVSFMCAKEPAVQADGVRIGKALLAFDTSALSAEVERIALTDANLKHQWGEAVWRVMLRSKADVTRGTWAMEVRAV